MVELFFVEVKCRNVSDFLDEVLFIGCSLQSVLAELLEHALLLFFSNVVDEVLEVIHVFVYKQYYPEESLENLLRYLRFKEHVLEVLYHDISVLNDKSWVGEVKTVVNCSSIAQVKANLIGLDTEDLEKLFFNHFLFVLIIVKVNYLVSDVFLSSMLIQHVSD